MNELMTINAAIVTTNDISRMMFDRFDKWLERKRVNPKTRETYTRALRQFGNYIIDNSIARPQEDDIEGYISSLVGEDEDNPLHEVSTVRSYLTAVKKFFAWTAKEGIYPNVAENVKASTPGRDHRKDALTTAQVKTLLGSIDQSTTKGMRDYAIVALLVTGGLRTIEVVRANIEDLRTVGDNPALFVKGKGKTDKSEFVRLSNATEAILRRYIASRTDAKPGDPLFTSTAQRNRGERMTTRAISGVVKAALKAAGYKSPRLTAHSLRHTAVTLALRAGMKLEEVQQFARHANITTTMIYNHAIERANNQCSDAISGAIF